MKKIMTYVRPYYAAIAFGLTIKTLGTFADLGLPYVLAHIINKILPMGKVYLILLWGGLMLVLAVLARAFNIMANRMAAKTARDSMENIRHDLFDRILHLSGTQSDTVSVPSLITRLTSDTYNVHNMIGMMQRIGIRAPMILLGGIIISFTMEPVLTMVLVLLIPILGVVIFQISKKGIPLYGNSQKSADNMVQVLREDIAGIRVIKALSKTEYEKDRFGDTNAALSSKEIKAGRTMAYTSPAMNVLLNTGLAVVLVIGAYRVSQGMTQPGTIVAFLTYFTMILNAVLMINRVFVILSRATASADRIAKVMELGEDLAKEEPERYEGDGYIVFENVSFGYHMGNRPGGFGQDADDEFAGTFYQDAGRKNGNNDSMKNGNDADSIEDKICLSNISFSIKKGGSLGIIGSTGSGKTTIVNLLMRYYDIDEGRIFVDGMNIKGYDLYTLRRKFGTVFQNDVVFSDTVFENVSFGRDLNMEDVEKAARTGQADGFINEKQDGYQYKASIKGADFSGGQKQRLFISRAIAANPDILILDDSSSALDYKTDAMLRNAIKANYTPLATIMVAQRISSVMGMDKVMVLEDGAIIGYGSHDELIVDCDVYKEIYESQMGSIS